LPAVLYEYESLALTIKEEHRLRVCENRALGRMFGSHREEVTGERRKYITRRFIIL
jgi:hypothetical protein